MKHLALALGALLFLPACAATMSAAPVGALSLKNGATVNLTQSWTSVPDGLHNAKGTVLTKDGMTLNRLHIMTVKSGKEMIDVNDKSLEYPVYTSGMSSLEKVNFVTASLSRLGLVDVKTASVTPATLGGSDGIRFDLNGKYASGLNMRGKVGMAETEAGLNMIIFIAPSEYYYGRDIAEVETMISSISFPS